MYRDNAVHANKISQRGDSLGSENAVVYSITQIGGPALVLIVKQTLVSRGGGGSCTNAASVLVPPLLTHKHK